MDIVSVLESTALYKWYHQRNVNREKETVAIRNRYFLQEGEELLQAFSKALNENNIVFWLEFGSLLGYYRENDFIKHDCDLDFGAYLEDAKKIRAALLAHGFEIIYEYMASDGGLEECYKYKHVTVDIFYFRKDEKVFYCNSFTVMSKFSFWGLITRYKCKVKRVEIPNNGFVKTTYKNVEVYIPEDVEKHLIMHYGQYYMIPNPKFDYKKESTNVKWYDYEDVQGVLRILKRVRFV